MRILDGVDNIPIINTNLPIVHFYGSTDFLDYEYMFKQSKKFYPNGFFLISGGAKGADTLSEICQKELMELNDEEANKLSLIILPNWSFYSKFAGIKRNDPMVNLSNEGMGFWNITEGREIENILLIEGPTYTRLTMKRSGTFDALRRWCNTDKKSKIFINFKNSYIDLSINSIAKNDIIVRTKFSKVIIANGFSRVVHGKRGSYIEIPENKIRKDNIFVPNEQKYRLTSDTNYYVEYRTKVDNIMIYFQKRIVKYADYKIGLYYVSMNDIYLPELYESNFKINDEIKLKRL